MRTSQSCCGNVFGLAADRLAVLIQRRGHARDGGQAHAGSAVRREAARRSTYLSTYQVPLNPTNATSYLDSMNPMIAG